MVNVVPTGPLLGNAVGRTEMVSVMVGWCRQWYVKLPDPQKVSSKVCPGESKPESQKSSGESPVLVWVLNPSLLQWTMVPVPTCTCWGEKKLSPIDTLVVAA